MSLKKLAGKLFFLPGWYAITLNPYFIARRGLYRGILKFASMQRNKKILDVGCGSKPYCKLFIGTTEYVGIDIEGGGHYDTVKKADVYFDGEHIPFADGSFDAVLCTQVLEHAKNPEALIHEICRVLKSGESACITMPFVWNEHEIPYDFRRYTRYEHTRILNANGFIIENITPTAGVFGTCGQLISAFIFETLGKKSLILKIVTSSLLCFPIQFLFFLLDIIFRNKWITLDYVIIARKK